MSISPVAQFTGQPYKPGTPMTYAAAVSFFSENILLPNTLVLGGNSIGCVRRIG